MHNRTLIQFSKGRTSRQAHRDLPASGAEGELLKDEELTRRGFDGREAVLYRANDPTMFRAEGRFKSTSVMLSEVETPDMTDPRAAAQWLYYNADVTIWLSRRTEPMPFHRRNVDGDECWFVHRGSGVVETEFGPIAYGEGDYVVIPKAVTHRWVVDRGETLLFGIESNGEMQAPTYGGLGRHAPFDPDVIRVPEPAPVDSDAGELEVRVKYDGEYSSIFMANHLCDVQGWKGDYFPFAFNIRDWNVIMSDTLHLPPSMHCLLVADGINIINLLPRPFESVDQVTSEWDEHPRVEWQIIMVEAWRPLRLDPILRS